MYGNTISNVSNTRGPGGGREVRERSAGACTRSPTKRQVPQGVPIPPTPPPPLPRHSIKMLSGAGPRVEDIKGCWSRAHETRERERERDNGIASPREKYKTQGRGAERKEGKEEGERGEASHSAVGPEHDLRSNPVWTEATLSLSLESAPPRGVLGAPPLIFSLLRVCGPSSRSPPISFGRRCRCRRRCCCARCLFKRILKYRI